MDFGVVGLDGFVDSTTEAPSDPETKLLKSLGSAFPKQNRSGFVDDDCHWRNSKIPKTDSGVSVASKTMPLHQGFPLLRSNTMLSVSSDGHQKEHMLSFSSVKSESCLQNKDCEMVGRNNQTSIFPYHQQKSSVYSRNTGCVSGSYSGSMHGPVAGIRGPFTPSQWIELEHQALIYKYLSSNVAVPSNLLIPLKKSLYPYGLTCSSAGSLPSNSRWGSFHLGFSGNTDPEPGRCRRTDGKKWRCSRDAVADQKYCERHINRGRHRSRKPVEGQSGHAAPGTANPTPMVATMTSSLSSPVMPSGGASNNLPIMQHQLKSMHPGAASNPGADAPVNRLLKKGTVCSRIHEPGGLSMMSSTVNPMSNKSGVKQEISLGESAQSEFGFVSSDSLLNPSQRGSYVNSKNYDSFLIFNDQEAHDQDQHPLRQFFEDWPKDQSSRSVMTWPEEFKSDWTQLSMSIPMSDFSSSSSSPTHDKLAQSPLRLSRELEPIQMNLGVSRNDSELLQKQTNQIAMSWGTSMGGPLGEALTNASSCVKASRVPPSLNLLSEGWDGGHLGSSPTGVLQKSTFCSLSNSS